MYGDRGLVLLTHDDQWARCSHQDTVLLPDGGVGLDWAEPPPPIRWAEDPWEGGRCRPAPDPPPAPGCPAGLTHDRWCRTWRTRPLQGTVELSHPGAGPAASGCPGALRHPTGVAVDLQDRLHVVESGGQAVLVTDLWSGRVLRRVPVLGRPVDVVADGDTVLVLTRHPDAVVRIAGARGPCPGSVLRAPCAHPRLRPERITRIAGRVVVLWRDAASEGADDEGTAVLADLSGHELLEAPGATDAEGTPEGLLVVARQPGQSFLRLRDRDGVLVEDEPVLAPHYDGAAVTVDPSGRVVYTTATGRRGTEGSSARHARTGTVTTYRLDSGSYRTRWGRVLLDACLPTGTTVRVRAVTSDEDEVEDPLEPQRPRRGDRPVPDPEKTPPLPSVTALDASGWLPVVRRGQDGLLERLRDSLGDGLGDGAGGTDDDWTTYESGVDAAPGRYLWLQVELTGTERTSPRLRRLRVETPGHQLLSALPRTFSAVEEQADFVHGFLTPAEGLLHDLDFAAAGRSVLVDPQTTPDELLPWVASLAGLVLDQRWPEQARRDLVAEAYRLYARRGTSAALERILELYLRRRSRVVEQWRLRGLGGAVLGLEPDGLRGPTVGGNSRASGMLGHFTVGGESPSTDSYRRFAHRFTVLVPGCLSEEQRTVVDDIVRRHKPAHTLGEVCELGDGLPVGRLRLGLTAYVGPRPGRSSAVLGQARLGVGGTVGTRFCGARVGATRVGGVRVG